MHVVFRSLALPLILLAALPVHASIAVDSSATYSQTFDSLATSGSAVAWVNDSTLAGWSLFNGLGNAVTTYGADNGSTNAGAFKSYGATGSSERAFGGLGSGGAYFGAPASGAVAGWLAVAFTNTGAAAFDGFALSFNGEQWRNGGNTSAQTTKLQYGFGSAFASVASWAATSAAFDFTSPVVGATAAAIDGNGAGHVTSLGESVTTSWAPGQTLWLRWVEVNDQGNDHGLAIDNLAFHAITSAVPEPGAAALLLAGLLGMGFVARRRR